MRNLISQRKENMKQIMSNHYVLNVQYSKLKLRLIIKSLEELPRTKSH